MKDKDPGTITDVKFPVKWSWAFVIAVLLATLAFYLYPDQRESIRFLVTTSGIAAALLGAIYIGKGLRSTVIQRNEARQELRVSEAMKFTARWNDPGMAGIRKSWAKIVTDMPDKTNDELRGILRGDEVLRLAAVSVLNFFEEISIARSKEIADDEVLRRFFRTILLSGFKRLGSFIETRRQDASSAVWREVEQTYDDWKRSV